jgi:dUTP pyrophosphatase
MSLYIYIHNEGLRNDMANHASRNTDSGFDIMLPGSIVNRGLNFLQTGVTVAAVDAQGNVMPCLLLPRSSIAKTPLRLANSIGLIDSGYRGEVIAAVDALDTYEVKHAQRLFQICQHNFLPWSNIVFVDSVNSLPKANDTRGGGGFGSTGA